MPEIAPQLLVLAPLSVAAGIDLYLTLLFLGASPTLGLWDRPLPGMLADLDSPSVLLVVGAMYLLEFVAERYATSALVWNAFHAIIRPLSGALLALLVLDGQPTSVVVAGAGLAALLASVAHGIRSGEAVIRWLGAVTTPSMLLVSVFEDVLVIGLVALALDLPGWATFATVLLAVVVAPRALPDLRAFAFAVRLAIARVFRPLTQRRWLWPDELPEWVRAALEDDDSLARGGALRGSPVGAYRLPGLPRFATGWLLVRGGSPLLVRMRRGSVEAVVLDGLQARDVVERTFFIRVDLTADDTRSASLFFSHEGPGTPGLQAEFLTGR